MTPATVLGMETTLRITRAARILADVVDDGVSAGLPEPYAVFSANYTAPHVAVSTFEDVEAWAAWLGTTTARELSHNGAVEFCRAVAERDGVTFDVTTNRPVSAS